MSNHLAGEAALAAIGIEKSFGANRVLRGVNLEVMPGQIHALLGGNGAGKSTLIKIIHGALEFDDGTVRVGHTNWRSADTRSPASVHAAGLRVLHQELNAARQLSVTENLLLGALPITRYGVVDWRRAHRMASDALAALDLRIDPRHAAGDLTTGQLQLVEIARALSQQAAVVILDEPTAALGRAEAQVLWSALQTGAKQGLSVVYVSHHLDEVLHIADRVTVLRDGLVSACQDVAGVALEDLHRWMFGDSVDDLERQLDPLRTTAAGTPEAIRLESVSVGRVVRDVSLTVHFGEIVVVSGGPGSGSSDLAAVASGATRPGLGSATSGGSGRMLRSRSAAAGRGIALVPGERSRRGIISANSVRDNVTLSMLARGPLRLYRRGRLARQVAEICAELGVTLTTVGQPISSLSGGNQQKVLLARWLSLGAQVYVLEDPTAGVDVKAKFEIYRRLRGLAADGAALLVFTSDEEEERCLADRAYRLIRGRLEPAASATGEATAGASQEVRPR